jgi:hypothetical protein
MTDAEHALMLLKILNEEVLSMSTNTSTSLIRPSWEAFNTRGERVYGPTATDVLRQLLVRSVARELTR